MKTDLNQLLTLLQTNRDTTNNLTGSWRYFRPVFAEKRGPCESACPAGNPIKDFMRHAAKGDTTAALASIKQENPLPSVCGRVCHHPCANSCTRNRTDDPLSPNLVERFCADSSEIHGLQLPRRERATNKRIAVVGAGPAGLTCAYHCALLGHNVTLFDSAEKPGGMLRAGIPEYRLPRAALDNDLCFIPELGIRFIPSTSIKDLSELAEFDAVLFSVGAHESRKLGIENETASGIIPGLSFLRAVNSGAPPQIGKTALVIGGGNTAIDCARAASRLGATATIAYRRSIEHMPALPDEIRDAREECINIIPHASPVRAISTNGKLTAVEFIKTQPGQPGPDGRPTFTTIPGSEFTIETDTLIAATGETPDTSTLPPELLIGDSFSAPPDTLLITIPPSGPALFAAGDALANAPRTVSHAIGMGKRAAISIDIYLKEKDTRESSVIDNDEDNDNARAIKREREAITDFLAFGGRRYGQGHADMRNKMKAWNKTAGIGGVDEYSATRGAIITDSPSFSELAPQALTAASISSGPAISMRAYKENREGSPIPAADTTSANIAHIIPAPSLKSVHLDATQRKTGFAEIDPGLDAAAAALEASRCLLCGECADCGICALYCPDISVFDKHGTRPDFDYNFCKGCGICAKECPHAALEMMEEEK